MGRKQSRIYLPRSTMRMDVVVTVEMLAKEKDISFGKALELILFESSTFNGKLEELKQDAPWFDEG